MQNLAETDSELLETPPLPTPVNSPFSAFSARAAASAGTGQHLAILA